MRTLTEFINEANTLKISWMPDGVVKSLLSGIKMGFISQKEGSKIVKYGISRENIMDVFVDDFTSEEIERAIAEIEKSGIKFKYETNDEWQKAGYEDPTV